MTNIAYLPLCASNTTNTTNLNEPGSMRKSTSIKRKRVATQHQQQQQQQGEEDSNERESVENEPLLSSANKRAKNELEQVVHNNQKNDLPIDVVSSKRTCGRPRRSLANTLSSTSKKRTPLKGVNSQQEENQQVTSYFQATLKQVDHLNENEKKQEISTSTYLTTKQQTRVYNSHRSKSTSRKCTKTQHLQRNKIATNTTTSCSPKEDNLVSDLKKKIVCTHEESLEMLALGIKTQHTHYAITNPTMNTLYTPIVSLKIKEVYLNEAESDEKVPIPDLDWASSRDLWKVMKQKEQLVYTHSHEYLYRHNGIESQMRGILLDWLVEICYAYRLHRETFHLACEYIDRFLSRTRDMGVDRLQLIGLTALFLAAKNEEIYPPKLHEFASHMESYSDDNEEAITQFELFMLKSLTWDISPVTANTWLSAYLQIASSHTQPTQTHTTQILLPLSHHKNYLKAITLIDLCLFDMDSLKFSYSELAATAMYHMITPKELTFSCSGYTHVQLEECINWMQSYADCVHDFEDKIDVEYFSNVDPDDAHNIQHYHQNLDLLKDAQLRKTPLKTMSTSSNSDYSSLLTPPDSNKKIKK